MPCDGNEHEHEHKHDSLGKSTAATATAGDFVVADLAGMQYSLPRL